MSGILLGAMWTVNALLAAVCVSAIVGRPATSLAGIWAPVLGPILGLLR